LRVSVIDTGIGISEDGLTRIFDSFTQADQSTTRKYGGTGLGLSICMKLVKAMGGDISASSTPGKGTRFDVTVPLEIVTNAPAVLPLPASERALVACRAPLSRDVIGGALAARGFEVTAVESAADCPKEQRFDLIVGDSQTLETIDAAGYSSRETIVLSEIGDFSAERLVAAGRAGAVLMRPVTTAACYAALEALLVPAEDRAQSRYAPTARVARQSPFANLRVLVADDSAVNREVVSLAMAQMGIAPDMVMNGLQAVAKFRANSYDIVFMDASMPDVDGFATTAMLREIELESGRARTPVIALTAHAMRHIADRIAESGMDGHLLKPFTLGTLRSALERHCPGSAKPAPADERMARIAAGNDDVIDHQTLSNLEEIAGTGAHEIVGKLYDMFQESAPPAMKRLRDAIRAGNSADIAHAAHALKSMALNMAAGRLSRRLALIEERSRSSAASISPDDAEAVASDLSTALAELARIMRARDALPDTAQAR
jgi:two-component system sensor histidine kinase BarA